MTDLRVAIFQPLIPAYRLPLFERLAKEPGIDLTVFAGGDIGSLPGAKPGGAFKAESAPVRHLLFGLRIQWAQVRASAFSDCDLIVLPWDAHYVALAPCIAMARARGIPLVLWGHGYSKQPRPIGELLRNAYGRFADGTLLYSRTTAERLIAEHSFSQEQVFVAPNALDQTSILKAREHWLREAAALARFQSSHSLDPSQTIVFVSRLEVDNRIDMLLRGMVMMRAKLPHARLILIGDGSDKARLLGLSTAMGLDQHVLFVGAEYDEYRLARWMLSAAVFCYPTNIGLSLLHAFGYGLPVVTSDNPRAHGPEIEALVHGENGLLFRAGDTEDMVNRWVELITDQALRRRLAAGALRTVAERHTMERMVNGFVELFAWARDRSARLTDTARCN